MHLSDDGWLVQQDGNPNVIAIPHKRTSALVEGGPFGLVWHFTSAGPGGPGHAEMLARRLLRPADPHHVASWHVIIAKDGTIYQGAPSTIGTWHAGAAGTIAGHKLDNINRGTFGVELESAGQLQRFQRGDELQFYCEPYYRGEKANGLDPALRVDPARAVYAGGRWWDKFTPAQERSAELLTRALVERHGWAREACAYGHSQFSENRNDPGPGWLLVTLPAILDRIFGAHA